MFYHIEYPPFEMGKSRFDQETFKGRFLHVLDHIDPRTLFTTEKELQRNIQLLKDFENGTIDPKVTDNELWKAQKIKQAIVHPDTGDKILPPFRMSGYIPFGTPVIVGLLIRNPTLRQTAFWQFVNQSHNAGVNYSNRNATKPLSMPLFLQAYTGACTVAVSIAVGFTLLVRRAEGFDRATRAFIERFVPFPAVVSAGVANVLLVRRHEYYQGIDVVDTRGNVVGTSREAAKKALKEIAISRFTLSGIIFVIPPLILTQLEKTVWLKKHPYTYQPINIFLCLASFTFSLPFSIALFPQMSQISRDKLEPELKAASNEPYLLYNRGL